jgi:hypothetical protein
MVLDLDGKSLYFASSRLASPKPVKLEAAPNLNQNLFPAYPITANQCPSRPATQAPMLLLMSETPPSLPNLAGVRVELNSPAFESANFIR